jgi:hypothetical protein
MKASNIAETAERKSLPGSMKEGMTDKARVICRDRLQWIVQRRRSVCPNSWRGVSFCRTREALLRCAGRGDPAAVARLRALPERFPEAPQI